MREQIQRTRELIAQLMEFVRGEPRSKLPLGASRLLSRVVAGARPEADARGVEIETRPVGSELEIDAYAVRLEHALLNLVRNAIQAARHRVRVSVEQPDEGVALVVEDDGPGVPADQRERIFEPFHTGRGEGTGLGLAIVKSVAEDHRAGVRIGSSADLGGSRFEILIPAS
jgi:signal transduction histidine kinase